MSDQRQIHVNRIREALDYIKIIRSEKITALDGRFEDWKERVKHSIEEVYGSDHQYRKRLRSLGWWNLRADIGEGIYWDKSDQEIFDKDLMKAERILKDALEELPVIKNNVKENHGKNMLHEILPQVVVNINNVVTQNIKLDIKQIISSLEDMGLSKEELDLAKENTKELAKEIDGKQRWSVIGKTLDVMKGLGKSVYEKVAIPIIIDMIKKQMDIAT